MALKLQDYEEVDYTVVRDMTDGTKRYTVPMADMMDAIAKGAQLNDSNGDTFVVKRTTTVKEVVVKLVTESVSPDPMEIG